MIVSIILAFLTIIYYPYQLVGTISLLYCSGFQIVKTIFFMSGYFCFFNIAISAFYFYLEQKITEPICKTNVGYWKTAGKLAILWFPHIIVKYPGAYCPDSASQLQQGLGLITFTSHHPPFHTFMIKVCILIGDKLFHSYNVGSFLFIFLQYLTMVLVFGHTIYYLEKRGMPNIVRWSMWIIYCVCPLIIGFMGIVLKDVIYSVFCLAFVNSCIMYLDDGRQLNRKNMIALVVSGTLTILTRNNGKEVIYPTLFIISIVTILQNRKNIKQVLKAGVVFILPIAVSMIISGVLVSHYNIVQGSIAEALSFPFQQTARTVLEHSDEIPSEEKEAIDRILHYDTLAERYSAGCSDPVKIMYNNASTRSDLLAYIKVWLKQFTRYPMTYFEATLNQNYRIFCLLKTRKPHYYHDAGVLYEDQVLISENVFLERIDETFSLFYENLQNLPIVNFLSNVSFWCVMLLILTVFAWHKKEYDYYIALLPLWLTIVCVILGPLTSARYLCPVVYSIPFLLGYYVSKKGTGCKDVR